jgi:ketosteroid isomerase-like protein
MAGTMHVTDDDRQSVAAEYLYALDNGGVRSDGESIITLFADDAELYFPKWGVAKGKAEIETMLAEIGATLNSISHVVVNWILSGTDTVVCEGTSQGEHRDGSWRVGEPDWGAGRWCDVFEIREGKIARCFVYLDPDYAGKDRARYPWLAARQAAVG